MKRQRNCSVKSYNRQMAKTGKANCNIMYKCHTVKKNNKRNYAYRTFKITKRHNTTIKNTAYLKHKFKSIVLYPESLGQNKPGVDKTPSKFTKLINHKGHRFVKTKMSNSLYKNVKRLYDINKSIKGRKVNIGGDHSMSIATIADTLNKYPDAKVIYFDAHGDINTYNSALAKNYHAMPLSFLTGLDKDVNGDFPFLKNKLSLKNLLFVGTRCLDEFEVDIIYKNNIKTITPDEINHDLATVLAKFDDFVGDSPFHISFDVDCIDPKYVPSTGTVDTGGIQLQKGIDILNHLYNKNVVNVDITELNVSLGSSSDVAKSMDSTYKLFKRFLE
jgi:arginase